MEPSRGKRLYEVSLEKSYFVKKFRQSFKQAQSKKKLIKVERGNNQCFFWTENPLVFEADPWVSHGGNDENSEQGEQPNEDPGWHETRVLRNSKINIDGSENHRFYWQKGSLHFEDQWIVCWPGKKSQK